MGKAKEKWFEEQQNNQDNWITKICTHCGSYYKINKVTKKEKSPENQLCNECYDNIILGK